jgi:hypothetical protein
MAVPSCDLGRCRLDGETELFTHMGLDFGRHLGIRADGPRDLANGDGLCGSLQPTEVPLQLEGPTRKLQPE